MQDASSSSSNFFPLSPPEPSRQPFNIDDLFDESVNFDPLILSPESSENDPYSPPPSPTDRYSHRSESGRRTLLPQLSSTPASSSASRTYIEQDTGPSSSSAARRSLSSSTVSCCNIMQTTRSEQAQKQDSSKAIGESDAEKTAFDKRKGKMAVTKVKKIQRKGTSDRKGKKRATNTTTTTTTTTVTNTTTTTASITNSSEGRKATSTRQPRRVSTPIRRSTRTLRTRSRTNNTSSTQQTGRSRRRKAPLQDSDGQRRRTKQSTSSYQPLRRSERIMSRNARVDIAPSH